MRVIHQRRMRDKKIEELKCGYSAYAESSELIRLIKRRITEEQLSVQWEETNTGCWFIPLTGQNQQITS